MGQHRRCLQCAGLEARTTAGLETGATFKQQILAHDLPAINLWYLDTLVVQNRRLMHVVPSPSGSYTFLEMAELRQN
jgi:hypothetical protein